MPRRRRNKKEAGPNDRSAKTETQQWKTKGNAAYNDGDFLSAAQHYTTALGFDPGSGALLSNLSAALLATCDLPGNAQAALVAAQACAQVRPDWFKAHYRMGSALRSLGRPEAAAGAFERGLELQPLSLEIKRALQSIRSAKPWDYATCPAAPSSLPIESSLRSAAAAQDSGCAGGLASSVAARAEPAADAACAVRRPRDASTPIGRAAHAASAADPAAPSQGLLAWLRAGGAKFPQLRLVEYAPGARGVHTRVDICRGQTRALLLANAARPVHASNWLPRGRPTPVPSSYWLFGLRHYLN